MKLPEKLTIIKAVHYDVPVIVKLMQEQEIEDIELEDVVAWIEDEVTSEFNSPLKELIFENEYGEEVYGTSKEMN